MPFLGRLASGLLSPRTMPLMPAKIIVPAQDAARVCGAAGCTSSWMKPWKSRRRPVFEDAWGCSSRCLQSMIALALRREMGGAANAVEEAPHQHRVPLGLVLLAQGWITHPQLQGALAAQRASGRGRIGDWLTEHCGLPEDRIARGLGVQWNCPVLALDGFSPRSMALMMPKRFVSEFGILPTRVAGSSILYVAFQQRMNAAVALGLEQMCDLRVESGLLTTTQFDSAQARLLASDAVPVHFQAVLDGDEMALAVAKILERKQPLASRLVRVQQYYWLRMWMEEAALPRKGSIPLSHEDIEDHVFVIL